MIEPRTNFYREDGTGRDSYIGRDSGGYRVNYKPFTKDLNCSNKFNRYSDMKFNVAPKVGTDLKIINARVKYTGNGSGRDGYVTDDYGGTVKKFTEQNLQLRQFKDNKLEMNKNRQKGTRTFTGAPSFPRNRPEFHGGSIGKIHSVGGV